MSKRIPYLTYDTKTEALITSDCYGRKKWISSKNINTGDHGLILVSHQSPSQVKNASDKE